MQNSHFTFSIWSKVEIRFCWSTNDLYLDLNYEFLKSLEPSLVQIESYCKVCQKFKGFEPSLHFFLKTISQLLIHKLTYKLAYESRTACTKNLTQLDLWLIWISIVKTKRK